MPIFEYTCNECGYRFEKLDRGASSPIDCPACGSVDVRKEISSFASGSSHEGCSTSSGGG
jgi:putative FmdB family regulatory protein